MAGQATGSSGAGEKVRLRLLRVLRVVGVDIQPGESRAAALLFFSLFFSLIFQYATKTIRQASFLDAFGAERLPWVYLLVPLVSYPGLLFYEALVRRFPPTRVLAITCLATSITLVLFWWLFGLSQAWVAFAFYLWVTVAIGLNLSLVWAVATVVLDPRQAKRLFGLLGAGAILGGIVGGQVARLVSVSFGARATLLAAAGALTVAAVCSFVSAPAQVVARERRGHEVGEAAGGGISAVRHSPFLSRLAGVLVLSMISAQIIDLQFNWVVQQATSGFSDRAAFFGNFYSVTGIAAALLQLFGTARIHRFLGVGFALRVLPASMAAGTAMLFVAATFWPAALLFSGLALKLGENGIRYSLDQSTRELMFVPVPRKTRMKAKAVIDVLLQRGAKGIAAIVLLPVAFGWLTPVGAAGLNLVIIALWLGMLPGLYREYVQAFRKRLHERDDGGEPDHAMPIDLADASTLEILIESLGSQDSRQVIHSLDLLASHGRGRLVPPLLLYHDDPEVRARTLEILDEAGRSDALPLIERRLGDADPGVRALAIRVLADLEAGDLGDLMAPRLMDSDPSIRAAAIACLATSESKESAQRAAEALYDMLSDAEVDSRVQGTRCLGAIPEPMFREQLVHLLYDRDYRVVNEAIGAVRRRVQRDGWTPMYLPTLISLLRDRRLKHEVREALVALGDQVLPALVHFLNDPEEQVWVRRALPITIAMLECPEAPIELLRNLSHQRDPFLRRKVIEAICSARAALPDEAVVADVVREQVRVEIRRFLKRKADLSALAGSPAPGPTMLLEQLLESRAQDHLTNVFGLLSLVYPPTHIWAAHRSLTQRRQEGHAHALEYLDNTLEGETRRNVMAALDERRLEDKLGDVGLQLGVGEVSRNDVLNRHLEATSADGADDADWSFFAAAALLAVHNADERTRLLEVATLSRSEDAFVAETARWVERQMKGPAR